MPVIINDFEITVEPPPPRSATTPGPPDAVPLPPSPEEIIAILAWDRERQARVRAN